MKKKFFVFVLLFITVALVATIFSCSPRNAVKAFLVRFDEGGGSRVPDVRTALIEEEPAPEKNGYVFEGWYSDDKKTERVYFPYQPENDVTLHAKYINLSVGNEENAYVLSGENYILSSYNGVSANLVIPQTYNDKPVVGIASGAIKFAHYLTTVYFYELDEVNQNFSLFPYLKSFVKRGTGGSFTVKGEVLFSDGGETLFCYPRARTDTVYSIPSGTKTIAKNAFRNAKNLREITLNKELTAIEEKFDSLSSLKSFVVHENDVFSEDDGVLYQGNVLLAYPASRVSTAYTLREGTEKIADDALTNANVKSLTLNAGLDDFGLQNALDHLEEINVENNPRYVSTDGVLYNADNELVRYPSAKEGETYRIKQGTVGIQSYAFYQVLLLREIVVPNSVVSVSKYSVTACETEKITFVSGSNLTHLDGGFLTAPGEPCDLYLSVGRPPETQIAELKESFRHVYVPKNVAALYRVVWVEMASKIADSDEEVPEYNVTLMNDEESSVYVCACMAEEPVLRRDGYAFVGWFSDETLLDQVTFPVFFIQDTVFYAKWNKIE